MSLPATAAETRTAESAERRRAPHDDEAVDACVEVFEELARDPTA